MRPMSLDQLVGQRELLGDGGVLSGMAGAGKLSSFILWGPPGCGKTTLARVLAGAVDGDFIELSAVSATVKDLREVYKRAEQRSRKHSPVLFIDEIHRFSKSQQDSLLGAVERGLVTLVGATTENPSFEVIGPLLSRAAVYVMKPLDEDDLELIVKRALADEQNGLGGRFELTEEALQALVKSARGDARRALNGLEIAAELCGGKPIDAEMVDKALQTRTSHYRQGEEHYDLISAYIKSVRADDPDAAIYYLARMLEAGEDPLFIARRMVVLAAEDIGLANPYALTIVVAVQQAVHFIGMPEARIVLAEATIFLATCHKSNSAYKAIEQALGDVKRQPNLAVPLHLRNAPTRLMKELGYSKGYKYPHDYEDNYVKENNLPKEMANKRYYSAGDNPAEQAVAKRRKAVREKHSDNRTKGS